MLAHAFNLVLSAIACLRCVEHGTRKSRWLHFAHSDYTRASQPTHPLIANRALPTHECQMLCCACAAHLQVWPEHLLPSLVQTCLHTSTASTAAASQPNIRTCPGPSTNNHARTDAIPCVSETHHQHKWRHCYVNQGDATGQSALCCCPTRARHRTFNGPEIAESSTCNRLQADSHVPRNPPLGKGWPNPPVEVHTVSLHTQN